jgi:predicted Zn-dependent protease
MGHEIAHATLRHGAERMTLGALAELVQTGADLVLKSQTDPEVHTGVMAALGLGAQVGFMLPYSRKHENEADEVGLKYMWKAGYDPAAAADFWEKMNAAGGESPPEFLSTHPHPESRAENLRKLAEELKKQKRP